jgi:signal transduction histidine kinase
MNVPAAPKVSRGRLRMPWYAATAYVLIAVAAAVALFGSPSTAINVAPIGILVGDVVAGIMFVSGATRFEGAERRAWSLVGIGLITATSGIAFVAVQVALGGDPPTFGASDAFFILGYLIILIGIGSLPHTEGDLLQRSRIGLDGVIGAVSLGALAWVFILEPIIVGLEGAPATDRVFGVLYPLLDVAIIVVVMIVTIRRSMLRFDPRLFLFAGAVLLQGIADVNYLVEGIGKDFVDTEPLFVGYLGAAALFLSAALMVDHVPPEREYADRRVPLWSMMIPYTAAAVMVAALLYRLWDADLDQGDTVLVIAAIAVALLVVVRQGIAIRENRTVVERERTDLVSSISHELRTPLTATIGFVAVLQEDPKLDLQERIEMIDIVMEQTMYLERIVQDLLFLAEDDPSRLVLKTAPWRIEPIIENAILSSMIGSEGVDVEVEPGLIAVVDANRLQQILVNLLSNARRYGGDECLVVARLDQSRLTLEVHDSGSGVPKKYELTIWDRFERGPNRYNAIEPGSGIGLSMVQSIATAHGGRALYRTSERLGGACFVVELAGRSPEPEPIVAMPSSKLAIG